MYYVLCVIIIPCETIVMFITSLNYSLSFFVGFFIADNVSTVWTGLDYLIIQKDI